MAFLETNFIGIILFFFGISFGSFLNVCISRLPEGKSIIWPGSHCPKCKTKIAWFDNLPLLSFCVLMGRCRQCKERISFRYPLVELLSGVLWVASWLLYGWTIMCGILIVFLSLLLAVTVTDLETGLIPDALTYPGMIAGLVVSIFYPGLHEVSGRVIGLREGALGLLAGGGAIYVTGFIGDRVFKKESMGGGDLKLMAMVGAFLGWQKVILTFFTAPFFALPVALYVRLRHKSETIPYGPYLAVAAALQFFYGATLWEYLFYA